MKITPKHQIILDVIRENGGHVDGNKLRDILVKEHAFTPRSAAAFIAKSDLFNYWYNGETNSQMVYAACDSTPDRAIELAYGGKDIISGVHLVIAHDGLGNWRTVDVPVGNWTHITNEPDSRNPDVLMGITTVGLLRHGKINLWLDLQMHGGLLLKQPASN